MTKTPFSSPCEGALFQLRKFDIRSEYCACAEAFCYFLLRLTATISVDQSEAHMFEKRRWVNRWGKHSFPLPIMNPMYFPLSLAQPVPGWTHDQDVRSCSWADRHYITLTRSLPFCAIWPILSQFPLVAMVRYFLLLCNLLLLLRNAFLLRDLKLAQNV